MKIQRLAALSVAFALLISFAGCAAPENGGGQAEQDQPEETSGSLLPRRTAVGTPLNCLRPLTL